MGSVWKNKILGIDKMKVNRLVMNWLLNGERGSSSEAIVSKMEHVPIFSHRANAHPIDPSDFNRCVKLLDCVPEYRRRLDEMRDVSPVWNELIEHWGELEQMLSDALEQGVAPEMYKYMKELGC